METEYLSLAKLHDQRHVAELFDRLHSEAVEVRDSDGKRAGLVYLEDFCNVRDLEVEPLGDIYSTEHCDDESILLSQVSQLSEEEIEYVRDVLFRKLGSSFVCCCDSRNTAESIVARISTPLMFNVRYTESVFDLHDGDRVLFLSFNRIKLYRKAFTGRISTMVALNNVVIDCENRSTFYGKYRDLLDTLFSMGVVGLYGIIPEADQLICLSDAARDRVAGHGKADYEFCAKILGGINSPDYIACLDQTKQCRVIDNGMFKALQDCRGDFYNVTNGMRITTGQPVEFSHTAYLFGPCTARGAMVSDGQTVASLLQEKFNSTNGGWLVLNCGVGGGTDLENSYRYVLSLPLKAGDAVLFLESGGFLEETTVDGNEVFRLSDAFNAHPLSGEWFLDRPAHCNAEANRVIADVFFKRISSRIKVSETSLEMIAVKRFKGCGKIFCDSPELRRYVDGISRHRFALKAGECAGAILMHGNPMTRGHKFLITEALKKCDYLYVFLLSLDCSEIPYALRKEMLLHETREFSNVQVLDCGAFQGSPKVFPAYFTKDAMRHSRIDATKEVLVFCQHIAPALGITKRFVGTENRDFVTRQYNNQLKLILPMYSIDLMEIERVTEGERDISAFATRQLIHEGRWEEVKKQVSEHTFELLYKHCQAGACDDRQ